MTKNKMLSIHSGYDKIPTASELRAKLGFKLGELPEGMKWDWWYDVSNRRGGKILVNAELEITSGVI